MPPCRLDVHKSEYIRNIQAISKPYNPLPLLPPNSDIESTHVLKIAHRALAKLKGMGGMLPHQSLFIDSIILQEAKDSSAIDNIEKYDLHTQEVFRYRQAL